MLIHICPPNWRGGDFMIAFDRVKLCGTAVDTFLFVVLVSARSQRNERAHVQLNGGVNIISTSAKSQPRIID
jgi:hypothetical protein